MKRYLRIEKYLTFKEVQYFTVRFEGEESETEKFFSNVDFIADVGLRESLKYMRRWLIKIGEEQGAQKNLFRPERNADALPPPEDWLDSFEKKRLRLYCYRLNDSTVILFNGCHKTKRNPEDCPNCRDQFLLTQQIASKIWNLLRDGKIKRGMGNIKDFGKVRLEINT